MNLLIRLKRITLVFFVALGTDLSRPRITHDSFRW